MEAVAVPARPRAVTILGWIWLVVAALQLLEGVIGLVVWKVGGLEEGLPLIGLQLKDGGVQLAYSQSAFRYALPVLLARVFLAGLAVWASFEFLRLKRWARRAMQAVSTLGILAAIGIGLYVYRSTVGLMGLEGVDPSEVRLAGAAAGAIVIVLGTAFFGMTLYALHRRDVRGAFENAA